MIIKGNHPTPGFEFIQGEGKDLTLTCCILWTPTTKLPKRRITIKNGKLKNIDGIRIKSHAEAHGVIAFARSNKIESVKVTFTIDKPVSINPQEAIPQLDLQQINVIALYHHYEHTQEELYQVIE